MLGIGLRREHFAAVLEQQPQIAWLELISENYLHKGSANLQTVLKIREHYPMSLHGVGLSLGSADGLQNTQLSYIKELIKQVNPFLVSEHLSWSTIAGMYLPDLLPVPYTQQALDIFMSNINHAQDYLQRELLIENPSSYLEFEDSSLAEADFLVRICQATGAKILLDVNNIFVSCHNHTWDATQYINAIPKNLVKEIHIAGHSKKKLDNGSHLLIDTHDNYVCDEVWELYDQAIVRFGAVPTLLEWDENLPSLDVLLEEVNKAAYAYA